MITPGLSFSVAFSPDGRRLASGSFDRTVKIWPVDEESLSADHSQPLTLEGHTHSVLFVVYSPDGKTIASASRDGTIKLWDGEDGTLRKTLFGHSHTVSCLAFSPDGQTLASSSRDRTLLLWDLNGSLERPRIASSGHRGAAWGVAFAPNNKTLATASQDKRIRLWDARDLRLLAIFHAPAGEPNRLTFSPDGRLLVTPHDDGRLFLWRLDQLETIARTNRSLKDWRTLLQQALFYFGYRLDGSVLVHELPYRLVPHNGFRFERNHPYQHLTRPRAANIGLLEYLEAGEQPGNIQ